jgi:hypothetical protein
METPWVENLFYSRRYQPFWENRCVGCGNPWITHFDDVYAGKIWNPIWCSDECLTIWLLSMGEGA